MTDLKPVKLPGNRIRGSRRYFKPYSLKHRLIISLFMTALMPLILVGSISYVSLSSILDNKAERGVRSHLNQVRFSLENTLSQLNHVSQQLAFDGRVGKNLERYFLADSYEKKALHDEIVSELSLINFTNPTLGLTFYYIEGTNRYLFENYRVQEPFDIDGLPVLMKTSKITYYGPHTSLNPLDGSQVFSVKRKVELPESDTLYLYIETSFRLAETIIKNDPLNSNTYHLILDGNGVVTYSEDERHFPVGSLLDGLSEDKTLVNGFYLFRDRQSPTWNIVAAVPQAAYDAEIDRWEKQFALLGTLSLAVGCLFAVIIWRTLYRPLRNLYLDIRAVRRNNLTAPSRWSNNLEFDTIHNEFTKMRQRISELIGEVERKEKRRAELEMERLMHQINPHFLHNTLDTIRWLARAKGEKEIDHLISTLNKVLHYNLSKRGEALIKDELEAIRQYIMLQGVRYNFQFDLRIYADETMLQRPVPKFILQPIVENALFHGLDDENGLIEVSVKEDGENGVMIRIKDNGQGMTEKEIERLLDGESDDHKSFGLGIGLQYVIRTLQFHFGERAGFQIESAPGQGTTVMVRLPTNEGGKQDVQGFSR